MRLGVLVLNYFLLFFVLLGLIHGVFVEGQDAAINRNAVVGLIVFLVVVIANLIYIHRSKEHGGHDDVL